ncbi:MAG: Sec-independent protein translocase subunit TatA/TatB [Candidatus Hecatellaceae archaeon]
MFEGAVTLQFAGIAGVEWIILLAIFLVFIFGSKKMPEIMRHLGKAMGEFEKSRIEIQREIMAASQAVQNPLSPQTQNVQPPPQSQPPVQIQGYQPKSKVKPARKSTGFLMKMAEELGVETENRSEEEIWEEIRKKALEKKAVEQLEAS